MVQKDEHADFINWQKKKESKWVKVSKQIKTVHIIMFFLLLAGGQWLTSTGKIQTNVFFVIVAAFIGVVLFLMYREPNESKLIPEHIIKQLAYEALENKRKEGREIPFDAKIRVTLVGECVYEQDAIQKTSGFIKRDVGFEIIRKGYRTPGVIGIHPYNGTVLGIRWEKLGYSGKGTRDRLIVPVGVVDQFKG